MPGVLVEMIGGTVTATVTTDSDGYYSFTIEYDGMYDLNFSRKGYSFNKSSLSVDMVGESITAESVDALPVDPEYTDQMVIFKRIPAGSFILGSQNGESDEKPLKNVTIASVNKCMNSARYSLYYSYGEYRRPDAQSPDPI